MLMRDTYDADGLLQSGSRVSRNNQSLLTKVYRSWWAFFFWTCAICLGSFYIGYTNTLISLIPDNRRQDIKPFFLVQIGSYPASAFMGALFCIFSTRKLSQKTTLLISSFTGILGSIILFFGYHKQLEIHVVLLVIGRILQGITGGIFSIYCPMMIKQMVPVDESVTFGSFHQFFIVLGLMTAKSFQAIFCNNLQNSLDWRILHFPVLIPVLVLSLFSFLIVFICKAQTPKYLIQNQKGQKARQLIQKLYKESFASEIYLDLDHEVNALQSSYFQGQYQMKSIKNRTIILGIFIAIVQQSSAISIVTTYGLYPYVQTQQQHRQNINNQIIWNAVQLFAVTLVVTLNLARHKFSQSIMRKVRQISQRRKLFLIGIICSILILASIVILQEVQDAYGSRQSYFNILNGIIIFFMFQYGLTLGPITWIYLSQILQMTEMVYACMASWITSFITVSLLPMIPGINFSGRENQPGDVSSGLSILVILNVVFFWFGIRYIVETKFKSQIQIYRSLISLKFNCIQSGDQQQRN